LLEERTLDSMNRHCIRDAFGVQGLLGSRSDLKKRRMPMKPFEIFVLVFGVSFLCGICPPAGAEKITIAVLDLDAKGEDLSKGIADALTETIRYEFSKQESLDLVVREKMSLEYAYSACEFSYKVRGNLKILGLIGLCPLSLTNEPAIWLPKGSVGAVNFAELLFAMWHS